MGRVSKVTGDTSEPMTLLLLLLLFSPFPKNVAQVAECWPNTQSPVQSPVLHKLNVMPHAYNPSTWEEETRESKVQGH